MTLKKQFVQHFYLPKNKSEMAADWLREKTGLEPAVLSEVKKKNDRISLYFPQKKSLSKITREFQKVFPVIKIAEEVLEETDWRNAWKKHFKSFQLTPQVRITPSWIASKKKVRAINLVIDPGMAFGTGLHETTQFVARMVEREKKKGGSFLDLGFGSGILSLLAAKYGYAPVIGIDLDENAVGVGNQNAAINNVAEAVQFFEIPLEKFAAKQRFDFVAANLDSKTLLELRKNIFSFLGKGGRLAISGIGKENHEEVHRAFSDLGLKCRHKYLGKEWCGFLYQKI